jgi:hypothetical protein
MRGGGNPLEVDPLVTTGSEIVDPEDPIFPDVPEVILTADELGDYAYLMDHTLHVLLDHIPERMTDS